MQVKNRNVMYLLLGISLAIYSAIVWIVPWEKNGLLVLSYCFTVVAFLFQGILWKMSWEQSESAMSKFYGISILRLGIIYLAVQIVLSFIIILASKVIPNWIPILLYIILLGMFLVGILATTKVKEQIDVLETRQKESTLSMKKLRIEAEYLSDTYTTQKKLETIAEKLRYSDPVSSDALMEEEKELVLLLEQVSQALQDENQELFDTLADEFLSKLEKRNRLCKMYK